MPECWSESRQIQQVMARVVDYHMHCLAVAVSASQQHLAASIPRLVCWQRRHLLHQSWNSPEKYQYVTHFYYYYYFTCTVA